MTYRVIAMVAVAAASAWANAGQPAAGQKVVVCASLNYDFHPAELIAAGMFAEIGIELEWHRDRSCPSDAIHVSFSGVTDRNFLPGALAYALPYEAAHIVVFYDRVRRHPDRRVTVLLAHVMVHEIAHILQGVSRHSESGIMMAQWGISEYNEMEFHPLRFTDFDVVLIRQGLARRETLLVAANY